VCVAEPSLVLQCLAYIKLLLQQLPSRPVPDEGAAISFDSLWETLLLLALKQEQPEIRWVGAECAAMQCCWHQLCDAAVHHFLLLDQCKEHTESWLYILWLPRHYNSSPPHYCFISASVAAITGPKQ
jgi:hypothetical protein